MGTLIVDPGLKKEAFSFAILIHPFYEVHHFVPVFT